jgi:hypothetical protein
LNDLGYVGLCDLGNQFIGREYSQAVIFSSKYIEILDEVKNPFIIGNSLRNENEFNVDNQPSLKYYKKIIFKIKDSIENNINPEFKGQIINISNNDDKIVIKVKLNSIKKNITNVDEEMHFLNISLNRFVKEFRNSNNFWSQRSSAEDCSKYLGFCGWSSRSVGTSAKFERRRVRRAHFVRRHGGQCAPRSASGARQ